MAGKDGRDSALGEASALLAHKPLTKDIRHIKIVAEKFQQVRCGLVASLEKERARCKILEERLSQAEQGEESATRATQQFLTLAKDYALLSRVTSRLKEEGTKCKEEIQEQKNRASVEADIAAARSAAWERRESQREVEKKAMLEDFKTKVEGMRRAHEAALSTLRLEMTAVREECAEELNLATLEFEDRTSRLTENIATLETENRSLQEQLSASNSHIEYLGSRMSELKRELESEKRRALDASRLLEMEKKRQQDASRLLDSERNRVLETNRTLELEKKRQLEAIQILEREKNRLSEANRALENEMNRQLTSSNGHIEYLESRLSDLQRTLENEKRRLLEANRALESEKKRVLEANRALSLAAATHVSQGPRAGPPPSATPYPQLSMAWRGVSAAKQPFVTGPTPSSPQRPAPRRRTQKKVFEDFEDTELVACPAPVLPGKAPSLAAASKTTRKTATDKKASKVPGKATSGTASVTAWRVSQEPPPAPADAPAPALQPASAGPNAPAAASKGFRFKRRVFGAFTSRCESPVPVAAVPGMPALGISPECVLPPARAVPREPMPPPEPTIPPEPELPPEPGITTEPEVPPAGPSATKQTSTTAAAQVAALKPTAAPASFLHFLSKLPASKMRWSVPAEVPKVPQRQPRQPKQAGASAAHTNTSGEELVSRDTPASGEAPSCEGASAQLQELRPGALATSAPAASAEESHGGRPEGAAVGAGMTGSGAHTAKEDSARADGPIPLDPPDKPTASPEPDIFASQPDDVLVSSGPSMSFSGHTQELASVSLEPSLIHPPSQESELTVPPTWEHAQETTATENEHDQQSTTPGVAHTLKGISSEHEETVKSVDRKHKEPTQTSTGPGDEHILESDAPENEHVMESNTAEKEQILERSIGPGDEHTLKSNATEDEHTRKDTSPGDEHALTPRPASAIPVLVHSPLTASVDAGAGPEAARSLTPPVRVALALDVRENGPAAEGPGSVTPEPDDALAAGASEARPPPVPPDDSQSCTDRAEAANGSPSQGALENDKTGTTGSPTSPPRQRTTLQDTLDGLTLTPPLRQAGDAPQPSTLPDGAHPVESNEVCLDDARGKNGQVEEADDHWYSPLSEPGDGDHVGDEEATEQPPEGAPIEAGALPRDEVAGCSAQDNQTTSHDHETPDKAQDSNSSLKRRRGSGTPPSPGPTAQSAEGNAEGPSQGPTEGAPRKETTPMIPKFRWKIKKRRLLWATDEHDLPFEVPD